MSFGFFPAPGAGALSIEEILKAALGPGVSLGSVALRTLTEALGEVGAVLRFEGDDSSHPSDLCLEGSRFPWEVEAAVREVEALLEGHDNLWGVQLDAGHPFYPVFWDFAFVFTHGAEAGVLIGSSSD
ncbi:MAG: hypothetical protein AAF196_19085 [Planctomycetota bacterium]